MITLTFICTRPDASVPFFHDSEEGISAMIALENVRMLSPGLVYTNELSPDLLVYTGIYEFADSGAEEKFVSDLLNEYPDFYFQRDAYYAAHGHTLEVVVS